MPLDDADRRHFVAALGALRDQLGQVLVIGGWAHRLFRHHPLARRGARAPIATTDADLVVRREDLAGADLGEILRDADFREDIVGRATPPVIHYVPETAVGADAFHLEFLTPQVGGATSWWS